MILVTGYENMDLDGAACAYAYAEFLGLKGVEARAGIFIKMHKEADFVFDNFNIKRLENANKLNFDKMILVDASDTRGISPKIDIGQVVEVIDHRPVHEASVFKNANIKIEMVGAAATLIAEKFYQEKMGISIGGSR